ncbi:MAG: carbohydrate ABC transporter permease [Oscillospiraceae bacterium]|uniref:Carbohydrate ABC transporter permease n=1 Tax=Aristaeella hokkaidonensis TaxID=3046382 RepID=A0AC61N9P3_9FIRM|nr:carbohydrate ABC transporter permease [Oscillospiraceae bacterium]QTE72899.1 carbohydrate ABC transporter permease [Clostridiales bacterium FE2011]QTE75852.1 carbohydrate ABC transporter permease [Clostridiales bacterium FE2010]QUC68611.1 carbohydrate ABC transporter permease [Aristaeella hokkaidonensis]
MVVKKAKIWTPAQIILTIVIILFSLTCLLPFVNVAAVSFSSKSAILRGDVSFWPVDFETTAYQAIFSDKSMTRSLVFTIIITVVYTLFSMIMTILMAYPLTKKRLRGRNFFSFLALFTMYFSGGIIPHYLNIKELGLMDSPWALILPGMLSTYNMIILKSFFQTLPNELEEAAIIDGANDFQVLLKVYLPLSMASLATLTLFYAVGKWNSFQDALYYIQTKAYQPLQLKLYHIIKGSQAVDVAALEGGASTVATSVSESIEPASIIFATLPILVVYPFVQRYFVAGVTIGAVKG